jgi:hypothetical protein
MSRPVRNVETKGIAKVPQKNGDIYVYERITKYDPEKGYTRNVSTKLIGKIVKGEGEIQPTRPRTKKNAEAKTAKREHVGQSGIFDWIEEQTRIKDHLAECFNAGDAEKIRTIARFWVARPKQTLPNLLNWQITHRTPYDEGISEDVYGSLFERLGQNESGIQSYFQKRAARCPKGGSLAFDSTTISTYSSQQIEARQGFNKDHDGLPTIKLLTLYSVENHEPIAFCKQPGNLSDVTSIANALKQLSTFEVEAPVIVTDNGYYSQENMTQFVRKHVKFLTRVNCSLSWIRELIDENVSQFDSYSACNPEFMPVVGFCVPVMKKFSWTRLRKRGDLSPGETEDAEHRIYVHLYRNLDNVARDKAAFALMLKTLESQLLSGETEFSPAAQENIDRFFTQSRRGRGGKLSVHIKEDAYLQAQKYFGYFALVSNKISDPFEALRTYRLREKIEEGFAILKGDLDARKPRTWHADNLRGRQFCQFTALSYICFLRWKIRQLKDDLAKEISSDMKALGEGEVLKGDLKKKKALLAWLENTSIAQILSWFDCTEETSVKTKVGTTRWSTENTERDRLFLRRLGVL